MCVCIDIFTFGVKFMDMYRFIILFMNKIYESKELSLFCFFQPIVTCHSGYLHRRRIRFCVCLSVRLFVCLTVNSLCQKVLSGFPEKILLSVANLQRKNWSTFGWTCFKKCCHGYHFGTFEGKTFKTHYLHFYLT